MDVDDYLETRHAHKSTAFFWNARIKNGVELFVDIFQLILKHGFREYIIRTQQFGGLLAQNVLIAADLLSHQFQYLAVHLFGGDVAEEPVVVHYIARFISYVGGSRRLSVFVHDETGKKRFTCHGGFDPGMYFTLSCKPAHSFSQVREILTLVPLPG